MAQRFLFAACLIIPAVVLVLAGPAACDDDSSPPPSPPTETAPPAPDYEAQVTIFRPDETPLEAVDRILALTDDEMDSLRVAQGRKADYLETAFYEMLARVSKLPQLAHEEFDQLQRPAYRSLLQHPGSYVGRPVRMTVLVYSVFQETSGVDHDPGLEWPRGRVKWMVRCWDADSRHGQQPLLVVSTVDPTPLLHQQINDLDEPLKIFNPHIAQLELVGVFYKIFQAEEAGLSDEPSRSRSGPPPVVRDYPLIVAWQFRSPEGAPTTSLPMAVVGTVIMASIVLVVVLGFLLRHIRRMRRQSLQPGQPLWPDRYRPLRDISADKLSPDQRGEEDEVDPDLKAAVDDWQSHHPEGKPDG